MENVQDAEIQEEVIETSIEETTEEPEEAAQEVEIGSDQYTGSIKKQISKIRTRAQKAESERDKLMAENKELREKFLKRPARPNPEVYEYGSNDPKYLEAMDVYDDEVHQWRQAQRQEPEVQAPDDRVADFIARAEPLIEKYPDFWDVADKPIFRGELSDELYDHERGPELAYYLGTHKTELNHMNSLSMTDPEKMKEQLEKIEKRLFTKQASKAPAPIKPVDESKGGVPKDLDEIKDDQEWRNKLKEQRRMKLRGG